MDTNTSADGAATSTFSIRLDEGRKARMDSLARATGRSRNYHFLAAVDDYLAEHEWELAEIEAGIREDDAGDIVSHEEAGVALIAAGLATREGIERERASLLASMAPPAQDPARNV
ncbi:MAG: ribbon-helix-helix protein, CopG family [Chloroflexi bacterium]|nr:ribbon-helix-helix protein, CopG family [Chloroflexota bacterium]